MRKHLSLLLGLLILASAPAAASSRASRLKIVTTIFPLMEFAKEIAGDRGEVSLLLPPGAGVHTWQPRASDILRLSSADLIIQVGAGLEPWLPDLLKSLSSSKPKVLPVADSLTLEEHVDQGGSRAEPDPHVWLDFGLDMVIADLIAAELTKIDPPGTSVFQAGAARLKGRLEKLDAAYSQALSRCASRTLVIGGHAAFGYLAKRYGLEQLSLTSLSPDAEALPSRLLSIMTWGREHGVRAVFAEANASSRMAEALAKELNAEVLMLHVAANLNKKEWDSGRSFFDIMEGNLINLKRGLACEERD
jgi:zinc transport system substrate-binding protein